jgi:hypothetical protein
MMPRRLSGDAGVVGGLEVLPFGLLTFVVGSLLVANAWAVVDTKLAVTSASREAVRRYVEAPDRSSAVERALAVGREAMRGHGRDPRELELQVDHDGNRPFARCVRVRAIATYPVPALDLPWIGGFARGFDVTASHSEIIDPFRAGLSGESVC